IIIYILSGCNIPQPTQSCCPCVDDSDYPVWAYAIFIIAAYIIGIFWSMICDFLFRGFRNNERMIQSEKTRVELQNPGKGCQNKTKEDILCWLPVIIYLIIDIVCGLVCCQLKTNNEEYYNAYYSLYNDKQLGSISIMEGQVALFRNCIIPLIVLGCITTCACLKSTLIIGGILCFVFMIFRQNKVYSLVWESYTYLK
ncbi:MAG: hypothetical protein K2N79_08580, partial [Muribaculaceae bacterium]|nr:hypothetical protein [Muribaculaceae bacterium]